MLFHSWPRSGSWLLRSNPSNLPAFKDHSFSFEVRPTADELIEVPSEELKLQFPQPQLKEPLPHPPEQAPQWRRWKEDWMRLTQLLLLPAQELTKTRVLLSFQSSLSRSLIWAGPEAGKSFSMNSAFLSLFHKCPSLRLGGRRLGEVQRRLTKRLPRCEGAKAARLRLGRFRAKVLYEKNIGEERSHSTEVRKERSETWLWRSATMNSY